MPTWDARFDLNVELTTPATVALLARVESLARDIRALPVPPEARARLDRLNVVRAVWGTTGIEGSTLSQAQVEEAIEATAEPTHPRGRMRQEARNAAAAMDYVRSAVTADAHVAVTQDLIASLHRIVTSGIPYEHNEPGRYRSHPVTVGRYTPPRDHHTIVRLMDEFVRWANGPATNGWPAAVKAIAAHFYLVSIHPFGDGNGRTSRAVESLLLYQGGINALGYYSLANFYYRRQDTYRRLLDSTMFGSARSLMPFVTFALEGLVEELEIVQQEALAEVRRATFREVAREAIGKTRHAARTRARLIELLRRFEEPVTVADVHAGRHTAALVYRALSDKTFRRDLRALQDLGLITIDAGIANVNMALLGERE